jgi:coenzyme F420 hydrogenase subunit beta
MKIQDGVFSPELDSAKCNHCGLCVRCCPGHAVDFKKLNESVFGKQVEDASIGNYLECYVGHSTDRKIRGISASGGVVTQLLAFGFDARLFDAALVVRMRKDSPLQTEAFVARRKEDLFFASKSKYCPTSVNEALCFLRKEEGRFALVGLPCQIHGLRKAEQELDDVKGKIVLCIGLFCSHSVSFEGTEFLAEKLGVRPEQIKEIIYRAPDSPGQMCLRLFNETNITLPMVGSWHAYMPIFSSFLFTPKRCAMCPDMTNELADISVGDAWFPEFKKSKLGESIVITRTWKGQEILNQARRAGTLLLLPADLERVKRSQLVPLTFKKADLKTRLEIIQSQRTPTPAFISARCKRERSVASYVRNLYVLSNMRISQNHALRRVLLRVPLQFHRLSYGVYMFFCRINRGERK